MAPQCSICVCGGRGAYLTATNTGFDWGLSVQFSTSNMRVLVGSISFETHKVVTTKATRLSTNRRKWKKTNQVVDNDNLNRFFK